MMTNALVNDSSTYLFQFFWRPRGFFYQTKKLHPTPAALF
jgi:hypothetical protein